ncbi:MAG TPA: hypothetical protein VEK57_26615 [Thermoanaerobaculia bacterium]|nr:hypothetical protein [Thermoanaerobaculia bacterium]
MKRRICALAVALALAPLVATAQSADPGPSGEPGPADPGQVIAFQWEGLHYMSPDGSGIHDPLAGDGMDTLHPDWSPDGTRIAFDVDSAAGTDIWTAAADGSDPALLIDHADCPSDCVLATLPAWSPDGGSVAFLRMRANDSGIVAFTIEVLDVATGETRVVVTAPRRTAIQYPRWCADGRSLIYQFTTFPTDGLERTTASGSAIAMVDAKAPDAVPVTLTDPTLFAGYPDCRWSDDRIVFTTYDLAEYHGTDEPSNLYTIRADGTDLTQLTTYGRADQRATQPTWTPDGTRILFTLVEDFPEFDHPRHAAFIDEDGGGLEVLAPNATHPRMRP